LDSLSSNSKLADAMTFARLSLDSPRNSPLRSHQSSARSPLASVGNVKATTLAKNNGSAGGRGGGGGGMKKEFAKTPESRTPSGRAMKRVRAGDTHYTHIFV
jgi:hypothetical protein